MSGVAMVASGTCVAERDRDVRVVTARIATPIGALVGAMRLGRGGARPPALAVLVFADRPHARARLEEMGALEAREDAGPFAEVRDALARYFGGDPRALDTTAGAPDGTAFERAVWARLRDVSAGSTTTYGAIAAAMGRPAASRAVGRANGRNPISLVIPCHRVVGASGALTGYAGGLERKAWLLRWEAGGG